MSLNQNTNTLETKLLSLIHWLLLLIMLVPMATWSKFIVPQPFTKAVVYYGLIEAAGALYVLLVVQNRAYLPRIRYTDTEGATRWHWMVVLMSMYLAVLVVATLLAVDRSASFWGSISWNSGLVMFLHGFALLFILAGVARDQRSWRRLLQLTVAVSSVCAGWAALQWIGGVEPKSFLGNRAHLAGLLLFGIFQALILYFDNRHDPDAKQIRHAYVAAAAVQLLVVWLLLDVRSGIAGSLAGIAAMGVAYAAAHRKKMIRRATIIIISLALIGLAVGSAVLLRQGTVASLFERSVTVNTRLVIWQVALSGIGQRPLFGYGLENFPVVFETNFDPRFYLGQAEGDTAYEFSAAQPHNKVIEVAVTSGLAGLAAYLGLFGIMLWHLFAQYRQTHQRFVLAVIGMWVAHFVHNLFLFDTITTFMQFFIMAAYTALLRYPSPPVLPATSAVDARSQRIAIGAVAGSGIIALTFFVVLPAIANYQGFQAYTALAQGNYARMIQLVLAQHALGQYPVQERTIIPIANVLPGRLAEKTTLSDAEKQMIQQLIYLAETVVARQPHITYNRIRLGTLYNLAGKRIDPAYYEKNLALQTESLSLSPRRPEIYYHLADTYIQIGKTEQAFAMTRQAIDLSPGYGYSYYVAGLTHLQTNDPDQAVGMFEHARDRGMNDERLWTALADAAYQAGDQRKTTEAVDQLMRIPAGGPSRLTQRAKLLIRIKQYASAQTVLEQLAKYPTYQQAAKEMREGIKESESPSSPSSL